VISSVAASLPEAFERAIAARGCVERTHLLAGHVVRIRYAGVAPLGFVDAALAGRGASGSPALTLHVWTDEAGPGHREASSYLRGARLAGVSDGVSGALGLFDADRAAGWSRFPAGRPPAFERATPLRFVLEAWAATRELSLLHAAAVGDERGGVLFLGRGGAGKTTAALACLGDGLRLAGDDYVLVDARARVHGIWTTANGSPAHLRAFFPGLEPDDGGARAVVTIPDASAGFPLRALLIPRFAGQRASTLRPATGADAVRAGAPQVHQDAGRPGALATLAALARAVPAFALDAGTDPAGIRAVVRALLA
jgi:hypothetical protein